ncbi:TetR/AcrR family transcriptional regulator [Atopomonas sediminilitoris]|uniref:TetR/AcrR family transcriptional regulator n=1 Tax=Atopomonas sediminilitoris TaxID=2919919 RepID=UPI001F4DFBCB|nr:TetR/AcrR family transcriptional regulator [Atopomonas sediminilitoris]MCJ8169162.1 TetR/AcrR family transcriptional regulator [Atopomonas sediminilitoris]
MTNASNDYHHGNLRHSLIEASLDLIGREGLEALSLRRLAEMVGVSRQAPYHHFRDKQALLAALGERGFMQLNRNLQHVVDDESTALDERLYQAVINYLNFALDNPALYGLMFGQILWRDGPEVHRDTDDFQRYAKDCFRQYVSLFDQLKRDGLVPPSDNTLRLAQLLWAAMHGLAKLASDGLFMKREDLADIARYTLARFRHSAPIQ